MRLKNKTAIVTGAGSGIGRAIAELFAREGAAVVVADIDETGGRATVEAVAKAGGRATFARCDVSKEAECIAAVGVAVAEFGGLNVVVNNAAAFIYGSVEQTTYEQWHKVWDVNVVGQAQIVKSALPALRRAGGGAIVNIASQSSFIAQANYVPYNSSKAGILQLTRCLAMDLAVDRVRVNAVSPGTIKTPAVDHCIRTLGMTLDEGYERFGNDAVLKRLGEPIEIANAVLFLASDEASYITGANLVVDGGATID
ncbi:MAG: SDR family oxidoreductase [Planctomycetia bacterium]|nr:SDR family oxidoreductase [Planctomycetia bacterium]